MLDKRICGARIVDGTGRPAYVGDVGIRAGRIVLHPQEEARQVLNARGLTLTPGLIDSHSHSDRYLGLDPEVGGRVMFPVQLAPFDAAFDLWAISAVMGIASAVALVTAGGDVRRWLGGVS